MEAQARIQEILLLGRNRPDTGGVMEQTARKPFQDGRFDSRHMTPSRIKTRMEQSTQASRSCRAERSRTPNRNRKEGEQLLARDIFSRQTIKQVPSATRQKVNQLHFIAGLLFVIFLVWLFSGGSQYASEQTIETPQYNHSSIGAVRRKHQAVNCQNDIENHLHRLIDTVRITGNLRLSELQEDIARRLSGQLYDQYYEKLIRMLERQGSLEISDGVIRLTADWWLHYST